MQNFGEVPNHYKTLGVSIKCTTNQLKEAFELKKRQNGDSSPQFMEKINLAFNTLKDSNSRMLHDAMLFKKESDDARTIREREYFEEQRRLAKEQLLYDKRNYYEIMHLQPNATQNDIGRRYQLWSYPSPLDRLQRAYETLSNRQLRANYDKTLAHQKAEKMRKQRERKERDEAIARENIEKAQAAILETERQRDIDRQKDQQQRCEENQRWREANPQYWPRHHDGSLVAYAGVEEFIGDVVEVPAFIMSLYVQAPIKQCTAMMSGDFSIDNPPKHLLLFVLSPITIAILATKQAIVVPTRVGITLGGLFCARATSSTPEVKTLQKPGSSLGGSN